MQPDYFPFYRLRFYWVLRVALRPLVLELGKLLSEGLLVELFALFHGLYDRLEEEVPTFGVVVADKAYFRMLTQDVCDAITYDGAVDYIFHLAGNASPHFINTDPVGIMKGNLLGTMNVLDWARVSGVAKVIFASTREVYGKNEEAELLDEQAYGTLDPQDDRSCYPESKRAAETLLKSYRLQYGVDFNTIRIAHAYGPTMTLENDGRVMADLMGDVVAGRDIVLKSSGEAVRAFLYVTDAVLGMFTVLFRGKAGEAYNLANETEPVSIRELAQRLAASRNDKTILVVVNEGDQKGYCSYRRTALDTTAIGHLGWKPRVSLGEGITRVVSSFTLIP